VNYEIKLVSKAVQGNAERLIAGGIEPAHFSDLQCREIWEYLVQQIQQYKAQPSPEEIEKEFPECEFEIVPDNVDFIKDKFIDELLKREARTYLMEIGEQIDNKDVRIDEMFLEKAKQLSQVVPSQRLSKLSSTRERIEAYKQRKKEDIGRGIRFGIPALDEVTLGYQPHEYITVSGFTGLGKSSLMLYMLMNAYVEDGKTPMLISLEMDEDQIYRKLDTMATQIPQWKFKTFELDKFEMEKWEKWAERAEQVKNDLILIDLEFATAEKIYAETSRWNPDVVAVDYLQLLRMPTYLKQPWQQVGELSRSMKQIAKQLKVPVIALSQTNTESAREGALLENLSESRAIGHHSDIVLGIHSDHQMQEINKMELRVNKNRDGAKKWIQMYVDFAKMEFREWRDTDEMQKPEKITYDWNAESPPDPAKVS
jgi:replicative DNA helicase